MSQVIQFLMQYTVQQTYKHLGSNKKIPENY